MKRKNRARQIEQETSQKSDNEPTPLCLLFGWEGIFDAPHDCQEEDEENS